MKKSFSPRLGVLAACLLAASASAAQAALVHHYDFGASANDTVGTSNATLINGATVSGGSLVTAGGGSGSAGTAPAAQLGASSTASITGDFSVETFFTVNDTTNFATLFSFANAPTTDYVIAVARRGDTPAIPSVAYRFQNGTELTLRGTTVLNTGTQYDLVTTYVASTGLASFYINGVSQATGTLLGINLSAFTTNDGINGGAPYGDPGLNGSNADFRIYNNALTQAQVTTLDGLGANATNAQIVAAVPEPGTVALMSLAGMAGLFFRRRRA